jgi:hypothetical protein
MEILRVAWGLWSGKGCVLGGSSLLGGRGLLGGSKCEGSRTMPRHCPSHLLAWNWRFMVCGGCGGDGLLEQRGLIVVVVVVCEGKAAGY